MLLLLFVFSSVSLVHARHVTVLIDTATAKTLDAELQERTRAALKNARDLYILPEDTLVVYTFDKVPHLVMSDTIEFTVGCADWDAALAVLTDHKIPYGDVYLIVDEDPCGPDPTPRARALAKMGYNIVAIGIGPEVSKQWLARVSSSPMSLSHYNNIRGHGLRDTVTTPITGWEIAAAVIVGVFIVVLVINSCIFAFRPTVVATQKIKKQPRV